MSGQFMLLCYLEVHRHKTSWSLFLALVNTNCNLNILLELQGSVIFDEECRDCRNSVQQRISLLYYQEVGYEGSSPLFQYNEH